MTVPSVTPTDAGVAEPTLTPTGTDRQRYAEGESNLEFEWSMLFDSVSLLVSYVWLCCGIIIFLAVPAFFIAVWRASKRRQQPEE
jgi:hypothetical protein